MKSRISNNPKLTVLLLTYNHQAYIAKCLGSIVAQETDFAFDVHVLDDASTDGTTDIILDYAGRYPDIIRPVIRKENVGPIDNVYMGLCDIKSEYFAFVEGDDYWTDHHKLQQQVDALDAHPDIDVCGHNTTIYELLTEKSRAFINKKFHAPVNVMRGISALVRPHPSARVFRNKYDFSSVENRYGVTCDTTMFWYFCLQNPAMIYIDKVMSVYNFTGTGFFSGSGKNRRKYFALNNIVAVNDALGGCYELFTYKRFMRALPRKSRPLFWIKYRLNAEKAYQYFIDLYKNI